jgi:amino acid transporter/mannitol/fructose-specific phosphotransferase system IIA component (Ntr-type)
MLAKAELATAMPKSGGVYFFIHRSLGPLAGTFSGLASWFSLSLKSAFALVGIGIFLQPLIPLISPYTVKIIAVVVTLLFTGLNILSAKESGKFQIIFVFTLISLLAVHVILSFSHLDINRLVPFAPKGWMSTLSTTGMIFVSFGGLTKIASVAEEIKNPAKSIPVGMFTAYSTVTLLYIVTIFVTVGLLDSAAFAQTLTPLSEAASQHSGRVGFLGLAVAAMLAFITTANAGLMAASRNPMAMANDNLLPRFFSKVSIRFKTPVVSILITALFMILVIIFLDLESLVKVASTMKLLLFSFVNLAVILMRESKIVSYKPTFRSPLYPYLQIGGILVYILLIVDMGILPLLITLGFFVVSLLWYLLASRSRSRKESALIHIVERLTNRELRSTTLSGELRDILLERDEITEDRFDQVIKDAEFLDLKQPAKVEELFQILSDSFSRYFRISEKKVFQLLQKREEESTTVIQEGLAIPHIIVPGRSLFHITVVRSVPGIDFGKDIPPVHIVFALAGAQNERNFHLQSLMAIAQIVQNTGFLANWLKARSMEELRNLVLLAQRVRKTEL